VDEEHDEPYKPVAEPLDDSVIPRRRRRRPPYDYPPEDPTPAEDPVRVDTTDMDPSTRQWYEERARLRAERREL
jgi:hypothetical protein